MPRMLAPTPPPVRFFPPVGCGGVAKRSSGHDTRSLSHVRQRVSSVAGSPSFRRRSRRCRSFCRSRVVVVIVVLLVPLSSSWEMPAVSMMPPSAPARRGFGVVVPDEARRRRQPSAQLPRHPRWGPMGADRPRAARILRREWRLTAGYAPPRWLRRVVGAAPRAPAVETRRAPGPPAVQPLNSPQPPLGACNCWVCV